eukprot:scaffold54825_cov34-Tisochrysis_lutea.AAC.5
MLRETVVQYPSEPHFTPRREGAPCPPLSSARKKTATQARINSSAVRHWKPASSACSCASRSALASIARLSNTLARAPPRSPPRLSSPCAASISIDPSSSSSSSLTSRVVSLVSACATVAYSRSARDSLAQPALAFSSVRLPMTPQRPTRSNMMSQLGQILFKKTPVVVPSRVAGISTVTTSYAIRGRCGTIGCFSQM